MKKLSEINVGCKVIVKGLLTTGYTRERMLALGLTEGAYIDVLRRGPKDNLTVYNIRGTQIALRKEESQNIVVDKL